MKSANLDPDELQASRELTAAQRNVRRETQEADIKAIMAGPSGRRFVHSILADCGIFASSLRDGPELIFFNEGQRNVGLRLLARVQGAAPEQYFDMLKENK
jgi:hypothetical protein